MLNVIGNEAVKQYYLARRLLLSFTRYRGIPTAEPHGIDNHNR